MSEPFVRADEGAERAVLAAILLEPELLATLAPVVRAADFYHPRHAAIFEALAALAARSEPVDVVTLAAELRAREQLAAVGGPAFLGALTDDVATAAHAEHHARTVAGHAAGRRIEAAGVVLVQASRDPSRDAAALRALAAETLGAIASHTTGRGPVSFAELADAFYDQLERVRACGPGIDGLTTGLADLDACLAGFHPGELIVLGARPRVGKTAAAMQMAVAAAKASGQPVLCFSLEMSALSLFGRTACAAAGVEGSAVRQGVLDQAAFDALTHAIADLAGLPIYLEDASGTTIADIRAAAAAMKARRGLALVICDYLQLVEATSARAGTREREVALMSRALKTLARELAVPVLVLSQLNREVDRRADNRPVLADLRESGALEQDADVVMFLYRDVLYHPDTATPDAAEVIVAKQRNGPTDTVRLRWEGNFTRFAGLEREAPARDWADAVEEDLDAAI